MNLSRLAARTRTLRPEVVTTHDDTRRPPRRPTPGASTPPPAPPYGTPTPSAAPYGAPNAAPYAAPYAGGPVGPVPLSDSDARLWSLLAHLGGLLFSFVAPLVIWLVFRERSRFVDEHAKEALNFQIALVIAYVVGSVLTLVLIGFVILAAAGIAALVFSILAAVAANKGEPYRYPVTLRLVK